MSTELKYLVVEDSLKVCEGIKERMDVNSNWSACPFAHHIEDAIIITKEEKPHLIFIDWALKGGSAYDVLYVVKNINNYNPYIIFNTGYQSENPEIPQEIINTYKVDKYLVKPFWEHLRKSLITFLEEAERKSFGNKQKVDFFVKDIYKVNRMICIDEIVCVCKEPNDFSLKTFYLGTKKTVTVKSTWQEIKNRLEKRGVDYFVTNNKEHFVVKEHIISYSRPYVRLRYFPRKIEVVKEKLHEFEAWLLS